MLIRSATESDVDGIIEVGSLAWRSTYTALVGDAYVERCLSAWWNRDAIRAAVASGPMLVALRGSEICGVLQYSSEANTCTIWKMYVRPHDQNQGVGRALIERLIRDLHGIDHLAVGYMDGNEGARVFYEKLGFVPTHRTADDFGGPDDVWLRLRLSRHE